MSAYHKNALPVGYELVEYTIDAVLGHGGFGITYLAHDRALESKVAIKEYLPHQMGQRDPRSAAVLPKPTREAVRDYHWGLKNFLKEARALAQFKHPHIVRVLRFFEANGTAYMVMEYERGQSLAQYLKQNGPRLDEPTLLRIFIPILNGLHAVHEAKMLHLDIKPENIYLREDGSPMLIDFGSARQAIAESTAGQRTVLTHGFAPIEQYPDKGKLGPWSDVYAVGASLYRCVTGKRPEGSLERYQAVLKYKTDPMTPAEKAAKGRYQAALLECIDWALKVHATERPQSAREFQDALMGKGRLVRQQAPANFKAAPTSAGGGFGRPIGQSVHRASSRAASRSVSRRSSAGIPAGLLLALLAAAGGYWYMQQHSEGPSARTPGTEIRQANAPTAGAVAPSRTAGAEPTASQPPTRSVARPAAMPLPAVVAHTLTGHGDWVTSLAVSADGKWVVSGSNDTTVRVWETQGGAPLGTLRGHSVAVNAVAIAPDGRWIASGSNDGTVRLWEARTGKQTGALRGYGYSFFVVAFSPDGQRVAAAGRDRAVFVWEVESGKRLFALEGHKGDINSLAFSPDGRHLVSGGADRTIRVWNPQNGSEVASFSGHKDTVLALNFSADGRMLASGDAGHVVRLWDASDFSPIRALSDTPQAVLGLSFSPDGHWLAVAAADRKVRVYDSDQGTLVQTLSGHEDFVNAVAFAANGALLATASRDRTVRLWRPAP